MHVKCGQYSCMLSCSPQVGAIVHYNKGIARSGQGLGKPGGYHLLQDHLLLEDQISHSLGAPALVRQPLPCVSLIVDSEGDC